MFVVHDGREQFVSVRVRRTAALPRVKAARRHVKEVIDHAGTDESVAGAVEIDPHGLLVPSANTSNFFARG